MHLLAVAELFVSQPWSICSILFYMSWCILFCIIKGFLHRSYLQLISWVNIYESWLQKSFLLFFSVIQSIGFLLLLNSVLLLSCYSNFFITSFSFIQNGTTATAMAMYLCLALTFLVTHNKCATVQFYFLLSRFMQTRHWHLRTVLQIWYSAYTHINLVTRWEPVCQSNCQPRVSYHSQFVFFFSIQFSCTLQMYFANVIAVSAVQLW